jgi:hypothetical protein
LLKELAPVSSQLGVPFLLELDGAYLVDHERKLFPLA